MPQITDIRPQKTRRLGMARFNVYLDGKFSFALSDEVLVRENLKNGQQISEEKVKKLIKENEFGKIYDRILKFLSFRPRTEKELLDWFGKKNVGEETKKMVWEKLGDLGYINDEEFARWWIEQRISFKPMGRYAIIRELRQKGINQDLIARTLDSLKVQVSEIDLAKRAAEKKMKIYKKLPFPEFRQKISAFLARRGFSWETIEEVSNQLTDVDEIGKKE